MSDDIPEAGKEWLLCPRCGYRMYLLDGKWMHDPDAPDCPHQEEKSND